jgi:hypothetical protein
MRYLLILTLLTSCVHQSVQIYCNGTPICKQIKGYNVNNTWHPEWSCSCPAMDEEYPTPAEEKFYVQAGESHDG